MALIELRHTLSSHTRETVRREMVELFLDEQCGTGTGVDCSRYNYIVEEYGAYKIILKRPGLLNKGFDFIIDIEGMGLCFRTMRRSTMQPSHYHIFSILKQIQGNPMYTYDTVRELIHQIFLLQNFNLDTVKDYCFLDWQNNNRPLGIILLAIKWLFIEQDITYWNWSGRYMFMKHLTNKGLA